jgi:DNA-binding response OmpR family regulator
MPADAPLILVVDDYADNRELFARRLEGEGFRVESAANGRDALERVGRGGVSLVLLDIMMPEMTGLDVLREVRNTHSPLELPIIMVTARTESADVVEALGLGANDYVMKPLDFAVVLARVKTQLRLQMARPAATVETAGGRAEIAEGTVLGGRYRLEKRIGSGSFGTVYRGRHLELERPVAVKVLHPSAVATPETLARFRREGVTACRVRHPNAVAVLDFGVTGDLAYLVMELLSGYPLEDELRGGRALPVARSVRIVAAVAEALAAAHHAGIVHRDIKPANIFLHQSGGAEVPKLLDFGIAQLAGEAAVRKRVTIDGWIVGTPVYMAPERFSHEPVNGQSDVYSLAVTLYQMLAGALPFPPDNADPAAVAQQHKEVPPPSLRARNKAVSEALEAVIFSALDKDPARRPAARDFAAELLSVTGLRPAAAAPTPNARPAQSPAPPAAEPTKIIPRRH